MRVGLLQACNFAAIHHGYEVSSFWLSIQIERIIEFCHDSLLAVTAEVLSTDYNGQAAPGNAVFHRSRMLISISLSAGARAVCVPMFGM